MKNQIKQHTNNQNQEMPKLFLLKNIHVMIKMNYIRENDFIQKIMIVLIKLFQAELRRNIEQLIKIRQKNIVKNGETQTKIKKRKWIEYTNQKIKRS